MKNETNDDVDFRDEEATAGLPASLRDPIGLWRRQRRWFLATLVVLLAGVVGATAFFPLRYESNATFTLTAKSIPDEFVPTTVVSSIVDQFDAIRSEVFSRKHLSEIIAETGVYAGEQKTVSRSKLVERLRKDLVIEPLGPKGQRSRGAVNSIAFKLSMTGKHPQILAEVVNTTVGHLINENVRYRSRQARLTTEFMRREFDRADAALRDHQRKLGEFREAHRGALPEDRVNDISTLDRLEEQRRTAILRLNDFQARLENLDARPELTGKDESLESLRTRLRHAKTLYTADHPSVRSLERQVQAMQSSEVPETVPYDLRRTVERAKIEEGVKSENLRLSQIDEEVGRLEQLLAQTPKISEEYAALVRLEQILQENYVEYLRKVKSAELALSLESAQQGARLKQIDAAVVATSPIVPRWQVACGGIVVALGLSVLVAIGRDLLNPVIIDERHLEEALSIPLLGSIPKIA